MVSQIQPETVTAPVESFKKHIRVLHVIENLNTQAVESWLLRILRASREEYSHVDWTFLCILGREGEYDDLARSLGAEVISSQHEVRDKVRFLHSLREFMKRGRYDILHCHHDLMSAVYLLASQGLPFRQRIVHVHNTSLSLPTPSRLKAGLLREPMRQMCLRMADQIVGVSQEALESLIGAGAADSVHHQVIHCAIDTEKFSCAKTDRDTFRADLGFTRSAEVLLFVGRLENHKNPAFVLEVLEHLVKTHETAVAIFAGSGNEEARLFELAERKGLSDRIRLLGFRDDVQDLMVNSDILIWPSREEIKEGLGLGVVEAQAAGLPVLMSLSVPEEAVVVAGLVESLPLATGPKAWAETAHEILRRPRPSQRESLRSIERSSFSLTAGVTDLMKLYGGLK